MSEVGVVVWLMGGRFKSADTNVTVCVTSGSRAQRSGTNRLVESKLRRG